MLSSYGLSYLKRRAAAGGGGGGGVLANGQLLDLNVDPVDYNIPAVIIFRTDGACEATNPDSNMADQYDWLLSGVPADFQIYCEKISGSTPSSGTLNSWLGLDVQRSWQLNGTTNKGCLLRFKLRRASDFVELDTAQVSLTYEYGLV